MILVGSLHVRPGRMEHRAISTEVILAGFRYVWKSKLLLGSISLDLFVVLLGGATALLPIFAHDLLRTGPQGLGALRAAPALGALAVSIWMTFRPSLAAARRIDVHRGRCFRIGNRRLRLIQELAAFPGRAHGGGGIGHGQCRDPVVDAAVGHARVYARQSERGEFALRWSFK